MLRGVARIFVSVFSCVLLLAVAGCTEAKREGSVAGVVQYRGGVVSEGLVALYSSEMGLGKHSVIGPDGTFLLDGLQYGVYQVAILPPQIIEDYGGKAAPAIVPKKVNNIPAKYGNPTTSGFSCEVSGRRTALNLVME